MKIRQTVQHFAAKASLELPLVRDAVKRKLVQLHTRVFLERAPKARRDERKERLDAFFEATIDAYRTALQEGLEEAKAREITHIQANLEFYRMGWIEMMEFPPNELAENLARYEGFFEKHGITPDAPLGTFAPDEGLPEAPRTPSERTEGQTPFAEAGYADATYVEDAEGHLRKNPDDPR